MYVCRVIVVKVTGRRSCPRDGSIEGGSATRCGTLTFTGGAKEYA